MCIAIYKPAGAWASKEQLRNSFESNPHGAGFSFHNGVEMETYKGYFTFRAFWKAYRTKITNEMETFIHFRIATRGSKTADNCHPYDLGNGVLMHNGPCLNYQHCGGDDEGDRSDSRQFAEDFIAGMNSTQVKRIQPMIETFIGTEKILMMFDDGEVVICNEKQGNWAHGCWWSNMAYLGYKKRTSSKSYSPPMSILGKYGFEDEDDDKSLEWDSFYTRKSTATNLIPFSEGKITGVYSTAMKKFVPKFVVYDGEDCIWSARFSAYIPVDTTDLERLSVDEDYVYEYDKNHICTIVGEVLHDTGHLELFLDNCDFVELSIAE